MAKVVRSTWDTQRAAQVWDESSGYLRPRHTETTHRVSGVRGAEMLRSAAPTFEHGLASGWRDIGIVIFDAGPATRQSVLMLRQTGPLSRAETVALLDPHLEDLGACFERAWARWRNWLSKIEGSPADVSARSRASALNDMIAAEVFRTFAPRADVRFRRRYGVLFMIVRDRLVLRFKKYKSRALRTCVNATDAARAFEGQLLFSDALARPVTHAVAGYLLDQMALDFERLAITCRLNGSALWDAIDLVPAGASVAHISVPVDGPAARTIVRSTRASRARTGSDDHPS